MEANADRVMTFRRLHDSGCFVMPNPWDAGSARALEQLGFKALATTSAGLAWTLGRADNRITLDQVLEHLREIVDAVKVPVNLLIYAPFMNFGEAAALGVRRISVGATLARVAWRDFLHAAREIADAGTFSCFDRLANVDALFRDR